LLRRVSRFWPLAGMYCRISASHPSGHVLAALNNDFTRWRERKSVRCPILSLGAGDETARLHCSSTELSSGVQHSKGWHLISALGQKRTCAVHQPMSALPPKATSNATWRNVRFGPKADMGSATGVRVARLILRRPYFNEERLS